MHAEKTLSTGCRHECDVLVVGAGPAGCSAALAAASGGASVIIIDSRRQAGVPVQCAEYVPVQLKNIIDIPEAAIAQTVTGMLTHTPDGEVEETRALGYILNRDLFIEGLLEKAADAGARVMLRHRALSNAEGSTFIVSAGVYKEIRSCVVIGADGPRSTVRRWSGAADPGYVHALQRSVGLLKRTDSIHTFFSRNIPGGYGWLFPKNGRANVGVGVVPSAGIKPSPVLRRLIDDLADRGMIDDHQQSCAGGLIPVSGPLKTRHGNILLAGDAAGHCHPLSGAGISNSIQAGKLAGEAAAEAARGDFNAALDGYEQEAEELFGPWLRRAAGLRKEFSDSWSMPGSDLSQVVRKTWIAFQEAGRSSPAGV